MEREFGGFAFPQTDFLVDGSTANYGDAGMTLRDYFAAKAMQGFITNLDTGEKRLIDVPQLAKSAYSIADAMLKAREASND